MGAVAEEELSDERAKEWFEQDTFDKLLKEAHSPPPTPVDNLLVRIHFIIVLIRWTGLAPWDFEFPFPGSLTPTFLVPPPPPPSGSGPVYLGRPN